MGLCPDFEDIVHVVLDPCDPFSWRHYYAFRLWCTNTPIQHFLIFILIKKGLEKPVKHEIQILLRTHNGLNKILRRVKLPLNITQILPFFCLVHFAQSIVVTDTICVIPSKQSRDSLETVQRQSRDINHPSSVTGLIAYP